MKHLLFTSLLVLSLFTSDAHAAEEAVPGGTPENCYVCRDRKWYLASDDGTCPKDKEVKECKKDDESTFGGCTGGNAVVGETCESTQEDKLGVSEGKSLFSPDNAAKLIPYGETGIDVSNEAKSAEFFENSSKPFVPTPTPQASADNSRPVLGINISAIFQDLVNRFGEFFALLFKGGIGTFQTIYTLGANPPKLDSDDVRGEFNRGARDLKASLLPANPNPLRDTTASVSFKQIKSDSLKTVISKAASGQCVPGELLMAISQREAGHVFGYSDEEVELFSTTGWQKTNPDKLWRGYCYNTCDEPGSNCSGQNVMGPMQFEFNTWRGLLPEIRAAIQAEFGEDVEEPDRCNLRDSIVGAAVKIKRDSQTGAGQCSNWDKQTVEDKVANRYCQCSDTANCGVNYCSSVWRLYQEYSN